MSGLAHNTHTCSATSSTSTLYQTMDEMDFERGIWYAAQHGDLKRVEKLLNNNIDPDERDLAGYTALHYAARNGHLQVCKVLLENGASINAITKSAHCTALHRACAAGKLEIVKFLLEKNADCRLKDSDGKTALHRAAASNSKEICESILFVAPELKTEVDIKCNFPYKYAHSEDLIRLLQ